MIRVTWSLNVAMIRKRLSFQVRFVGTTETLGNFAWCQYTKFVCISIDSCSGRVGERLIVNERFP